MNFDLSGGGGGGVKGRHKPNAITQRDAIFLFSKVNTHPSTERNSLRYARENCTSLRGFRLDNIPTSCLQLTRNELRIYFTCLSSNRSWLPLVLASALVFHWTMDQDMDRYVK